MNYRSVLEVIKFSGASDILRYQSIASAQWRSAAMSGELWWTQCQNRGVSDEYLSAFKSPIEAYRSLRSAHFFVFYNPNTEKLYWYNCDKAACENVKKFYHPEVIQRESQLALLGDMSVIVCGGKFPSTRVLKISRNCELVEMPKLKTPRHHLGLIYFRTKLYAFGGEHKDTVLDSSESLLLTAPRWFSAGTMQFPHSSFMPCSYGMQIYLCGGSFCTECEVYDSVEHTFTALPIALPAQGFTAALTTEDRMILLHSHFILHIALASHTVIKSEMSTKQFRNMAMRPVVGQHYIFLLTEEPQQYYLYSLPNCQYYTTRHVIVQAKVRVTYDAEFNIIKEMPPEASWT